MTCWLISITRRPRCGSAMVCSCVGDDCHAKPQATRRSLRILPAIGLADQADQFDDVVDLHLLQHAGPVFGDRLLADPQLAGDLLGVLAGHQPIEHLALAVRERFQAGRQFGRARGLLLPLGVAVDRLLDAGQQRLGG